MRRISAYLIFALVFLGLSANTKAQDILVPAGTLLRCTLDEPNFSSATADIGDPVICHLSSLREFGQNVFPRGSYLGGHLEADKEPGHFFGKGDLKITFDRVILPTGDLPLPAKVIAAKGYKVDKQGDIKGNGHATRDAVEWMIPPLWPWKVAMLPARGPRPTLKGEEPMQLRLMDDIVVPKTLAARFDHSDRPPYAASSTRPSSFSDVRPPNAIQQAVAEEKSKGTLVAAALNGRDTGNAPAARVTVLALTSNQVLEVTKFRIDGGVVSYRALSGTEGSVDEAQVDWRKTTEMTSQVRSADRPMMSSQTN